MIKLTTLGLTVEDICNLRIDDCYKVSNTIDIRNDKNEIIRTLTVDDNTMDLVMDAINQERYEVNNGDERT